MVATRKRMRGDKKPGQWCSGLVFAYENNFLCFCCVAFWLGQCYSSLRSTARYSFLPVDVYPVMSITLSADLSRMMEL